MRNPAITTGGAPVTKRLSFTEAFIRRAIAGAYRAGLPIAAVTIHADGAVTIHSKPVLSSQSADAPKWAHTDREEDESDGADTVTIHHQAVAVPLA